MWDKREPGTVKFVKQHRKMLTKNLEVANEKLAEAKRRGDQDEVRAREQNLQKQETKMHDLNVNHLIVLDGKNGRPELRQQMTRDQIRRNDSLRNQEQANRARVAAMQQDMSMRMQRLTHEATAPNAAASASEPSGMETASASESSDTETESSEYSEEDIGLPPAGTVIAVTAAAIKSRYDHLVGPGSSAAPVTATAPVQADVKTEASVQASVTSAVVAPAAESASSQAVELEPEPAPEASKLEQGPQSRKPDDAASSSGEQHQPRQPGLDLYPRGIRLPPIPTKWSPTFQHDNVRWSSPSRQPAGSASSATGCISQLHFCGDHEIDPLGKKDWEKATFFDKHM